MKEVCDFLAQEELDKITEATDKAELLTSGEIKVVIRCARERGLSTHKQALAEFYGHGLDKTKDQTGVLIFVLLENREIEVLGDKGINNEVPNGYWNGVVEMIRSGFKAGKGSEGICRAVAEVGRLLQEKFPRKPDDKNELPNEVIQG